MKTDKGESPLILRQHFNAVADAYCLLLQNPQNDNDYTVAWKSRHKRTLIEPVNFSEHVSAVQHFDMAVHSNDDILPHKDITKDWQRKRVYRWENENVEEYADPIDINRAKRLIRTVAKDYNIPPPTLIWRKKGGSIYTPDHKIKFGHRDDVSLLHEMGHAILNKKVDLAGLPHHSPAFVWMAIELYNRYAHVDLQHLVTTAAKADILGDMQAEGKTNTLSLAVRPNV